MSNLFNKHKDPIREESEVAYADMLKKKSEADSKYGWNRLMQLINADLKTKVWKQQHLLSHARGEMNYERIKRLSEGMIKGIDLCYEDAASRGFKPLNPSIWVTNHPQSNIQIFIALNNEEMPAVMCMAEAEPPSLFFSIKEIFNLIRDDHEILDLKTRFGKTFGNVEILSRKPVSEEEIGEAICDELI